jgi:pimeloyl-ACP methyl ester carboxylesterase
MRNSTVFIEVDDAGQYESEVFDCKDPKSVVICAHGNGVRRWDGENFFYNVADRFASHAFYLVDQTQPFEDGCELISLELMVARLQNLIEQAMKDHPDTQVVILAHSMGCGVASLLDISKVSRMIFVTPASGDVVDLMISRYGKNILNGGMVRTSDGLNKLLSKGYIDSVTDVVWEEKYKRLLSNFKEVYAYEAANDEILSLERREATRSLPFKVHKIIDGATHNFHGQALELLFKEIEDLI